jgi:adenylylsulfate kinase
VERETKRPFAVWITGLPASGKSTLTAALRKLLAARGVDVAVLESDALRQVFTPRPRYDDEERDDFYRQMVFVGRLLIERGVPVIFDATANRRAYRDRAREQIPQFLEVYVATPLGTCIARDPKGIYRKGQEGGASTVPGIQAVYEPPERPDVVVNGDRDQPEAAARRIVSALSERNYL